eukprot:s746_g8.t1
MASTARIKLPAVVAVAAAALGPVSMRGNAERGLRCTRQPRFALALVELWIARSHDRRAKASQHALAKEQVKVKNSEAVAEAQAGNEAIQAQVERLDAGLCLLPHCRLRLVIPSVLGDQLEVNQQKLTAVRKPSTRRFAVDARTGRSAIGCGFWPILCEKGRGCRRKKPEKSFQAFHGD